MRKKFLSLITAGTMIAVCLSGCNLTNSIVQETQQEIEEAKENAEQEGEALQEDLDKAVDDLLKSMQYMFRQEQMRQMLSARLQRKHGTHLPMSRRNL